jgi:hypothetical protein
MRPNIGGDWVSAHFMVLLPKINHKVQGFSAAIPFCERRGTYSSPKKMVIYPGLKGMALSPLQSNKSNRPRGGLLTFRHELGLKALEKATLKYSNR